MPAAAWPTETYAGAGKRSSSTAKPFSCAISRRTPNGDSFVFFRRSDVIVTGDLFTTTSYPVLDVERGGSLNGVIDGLNRIIDIAIPKDWQEGGTMVIPGHGRIGDEADVVEYRDMLTIIRDRIQDMIGQRHDARTGAGGAADVRIRRPLRRRPTGPWTTEMFVEAAYRDLAAGETDSGGRGDDADARAHRPRVALGVADRAGALAAFAPSAARARRLRRRRRGRRRPSISPATGSRSSPKTGAGAC